MPKNIDSRVDALYETLRREIELFPADKQLPPFRALMERHSCSRQTLTRAIRRLVDGNAVRLEKRRGMFTNADGNRLIRRVLFVRVDWCSDSAERFSRAFREVFSARPSIEFTELRYPPERCCEFLENLNQTVADALIVWPEDLPPEQLLRLLSLRLPVILFASGVLLCGSNAFDLQEAEAGMLAARHLLDHGHRRIALLVTEPMKQTTFQIVNGFTDYLHLHGVTPRIIDCRIRSGEASFSKSYEVLRHRFFRSSPEFTGCFVLSDRSALEAIRVFGELGLRVPKDISVIGYQDEPAGARASPPLTSIRFDVERIAALLAGGVDGLFSGIPFGIRRTPPVLVERASVANPLESKVGK